MGSRQLETVQTEIKKAASSAGGRVPCEKEAVECSSVTAFAPTMMLRQRSNAIIDGHNMKARRSVKAITSASAKLSSTNSP